MKRILYLFFVIAIGICCNNQSEPQSENQFERADAGVNAIALNTYYLSPTGKDANAGTQAAPWKTLNRAWQTIQAGDLLYIRGGQYSFTSQQSLFGKNGTSTSMLMVWAYPGEIPVFTSDPSYPSDGQDLIRFDGNYVHWKGIEISNFRGSGSYNAFRSEASNNCIYELMNIHHNNSSMAVRGASTGNVILNSDFHHNANPNDLGGSDGLNISIIPSTSANNTIRGCRAWYNSDDGFDTWWNEGYVLIENSWAWRNGYIEGGLSPAGDGGGIKLGETQGSYFTTVKRTVRNCLIVGNRKFGIVENNLRSKSLVENCTVVDHSVYGFWVGAWDVRAIMTLNKNIGYKQPDGVADHVIQTGNSWQGKTANDQDFQSVDITQLDGARLPDGSLPNITAYKTVTGSDVAGLGYVQGTSTTPPVLIPPTVNSGSDQAVQLPNTLTLSGVATGNGGATITLYKWSKVSGSGTITSPSTAMTGVTGLSVGQSVFELTVTDSKGQTAKDQVQVTIISAPLPPTIYDTVKCSVIWYDKGSGTTPSRKSVTYFVVKPNGIFDNTGANVNVFFYIGTDGVKRSVSGTKL